MGNIERRLLCGFWLTTMLPAAWAEVPFNPYGKPQSSDSEIRAQAAERKAAELERQLREAQRTRAASPGAEKPVAVTPASPSPLAPNDDALSVFRDKLSDGSLGPEMVVIPSGSFDMGSPAGDPERISDEVSMQRINLKSYALGKTEVTQKQWRQVMGSAPSGSPFKGCDSCPVENVSWNDVQKYIEQLNTKTGKRYRLPSESEWEYACRGGKVGEKYCGGNDVGAVGWYDKNSDSKTHTVGQKQANGYGLYDMSGNVREWVEDAYHDSYNGILQDGSAWTVGGDQGRRVLRGGSWGNFPSDVRSATRNYFSPADRSVDIGFRLARTLP